MSLKINFNLLEGSYLERKYENAIEMYLFIIEKNLNGMMEFQK